MFCKCQLDSEKACTDSNEELFRQAYINLKTLSQEARQMAYYIDEIEDLIDQMGEPIRAKFRNIGYPRKLTKKNPS